MESVDHSTTPDRTAIILRWTVGGLLALLMIGAVLVGMAYAMSPAAIRRPSGTHYHFRIQIMSAGKAVNFADAAYQTPLNSDICTAKLTNEPIHFHDHMDQFAHIHWAHITGGLFLKNYGWNFVGGLPNLLGVRFDRLPALTIVPIHGHALPNPPTGAHYYIYTGDEHGYQQRSWDDFLHQDINSFFGHAMVSTATSGWWNWLVPAASAHGDETELTELNHVVGSAVIFAQDTPPTDQQIKDRFAHLVPLPESTCGG